MKKLSYLALSLVTICLFSCGNKSAADQAHVDSLETSLVESTADNQQLNEFLTVVATALDSIEMQETQLYNTGSESPVPNQAKIKSQLSHLKETLKSQRERIGQLEKQMKLDADNAKKLQRVVTALKNQLADKEKQIASLEEEIADKNITIDGLRNYMSQLRQQNTQQQEVIESQSQTMQAQDQQRNRLFDRKGTGPLHEPKGKENQHQAREMHDEFDRNGLLLEPGINGKEQRGCIYGFPFPKCVCKDFPKQNNRKPAEQQDKKMIKKRVFFE